MNFTTSSLESKWISQINEWLEAQVKQKRIKSLFLPAGNTPIPLYKDWEENKPEFLQHIDFIQLDEVIKGDKVGIFREFFNKHLPSYAHQIKWISEGDLEGADIGLLGLGKNGHIAFHEPGLSPSFTSGCVLLTEETKKNLNMDRPTWGLTYGTADLLKSKALLVIVQGKAKRTIVDKFVNKDPELPASHLHKLSDLSLFYLEN